MKLTERSSLSRKALIDKLLPLWFKDLWHDRFRYEVFWGQRFDLDLSAIDPNLCMKIILQEVYKSGRIDWEFDIKEQIKEIL